MGEIYDHHNEKRDRLVGAVIKELELSGKDTRKGLESLRKEYPYVDSYLNDYPFDSPAVEAPASH
jgi:hypothetical protein